MSEEVVKGKRLMTEAEMDKVTKSTAELLREQPKVKIKIYLPPEDRKKLETAQESGKTVVWPSEFVSVNGHNYQIQKGVEVEVPQSVAAVLEGAGLI